MQPSVWSPPVELSPAERAIMKRIKRAKLFTFLRQERHTLFDAAFQEQLATLYKDAPSGQPPIPPAQLALATILQAYTGVSDDELIECLTMDRRWQLVLDCLDASEPPFTKPTLVAFRDRLIATNADRWLLDRTIARAAATRLIGARQLRAALDSSPLWGAGRVEDTYNLLGHALHQALRVIARQQGRGLADTAVDAGVGLAVDRSLKAALDLDWDDPHASQVALTMIVDALTQVDTYLECRPELVAAAPAVLVPLAAAAQVQAQDVTTTERDQPTLRQGVAPDRRISLSDAQMRHGRKSRTRLIDGYKRHVLHDLDSGLVRVVGITPANAPEAHVTDALSLDLAQQDAELTELHIDRAYLSSRWVTERDDGLQIYCKAWPVRHGPQFPKTAFTLDWDTQTIRCPDGAELPFTPGALVNFPEERCATCPLRTQCTTSKHGRSVRIHPDERLHQELRERQRTPEGRAKLRERVAVEHNLSHIGHWQGDRARYRGERKNLFDLRRTAVVHNLHVLMRHEAAALAA
jgi:hypothetical protein